MVTVYNGPLSHMDSSVYIYLYVTRLDEISLMSAIQKMSYLYVLIGHFVLVILH